MYQSIARNIVNYFNANRQRGHTTAMMRGADDCIILMIDKSQERDLRKKYPDIQFTVAGFLTPDLLGRHKPLLIDHAYLTKLLTGMMDEAALNKEGAVNDAYRAVIKILQNSRSVANAISLLEENLKQRNRQYAKKDDSNSDSAGGDSPGDGGGRHILPF